MATEINNAEQDRRIAAAELALTVARRIQNWPHEDQLRLLAEVRRLLGCKDAIESPR